jgi:hypothetical protein
MFLQAIQNLIEFVEPLGAEKLGSGGKLRLSKKKDFLNKERGIFKRNSTICP